MQKITALLAVVSAIVGGLAGVITAGALPYDLQGIPRVGTMTIGIVLIVFAVRLPAEVAISRTRLRSTVITSAALFSVLVATGGVLYASHAPRGAWLGIPGMLVTIVGLGCSALILRGGYRAATSKTQ
jgi:hypothetical protein